MSEMAHSLVAASLVADGWSALVCRLGAGEDLDVSARASGALIRRRAIKNAATLLRLALAYGSGMSLREASAWAGLTGVATISDVALLNRLRGAADWLGEVAGKLLGGPPGLPGALRIVDGTMVSPPGPSGREWRLHATYDLARQRFDALSLTDRHGAEALERSAVAPGEIRLADRCYARPDGLSHVIGQGGDYVVRIGWKSLRLRRPDGEALDLPSFLEALPAEEGADLPVVVEHSRRRRFTPLACRLVIIPKTPEALARSEAKAKRASQRGGHRLDPRSLTAARYVLLLTSLPAAPYSSQRIGDLYRLRWQIELAFKRLKSLVRFDELPAKDERLARAWLYANLIIALLGDDLGRDLLDIPP